LKLESALKGWPQTWVRVIETGAEHLWRVDLAGDWSLAAWRWFCGVVCIWCQTERAEGASSSKNLTRLGLDEVGAGVGGCFALEDKGTKVFEGFVVGGRFLLPAWHTVIVIFFMCDPFVALVTPTPVPALV